jgi:hypothetical protein
VLVVVSIRLDVEEIHQRVGTRGREQPAINREQLDQWPASFEIPTDDETRPWGRSINLNNLRGHHTIRRHAS